MVSSQQLTPEELAVITMIRKNSYQDIIIQIQDSIIVSVDQVIKYRRKKGGGFLFGNKKMNLPLILTPGEIKLIQKIREDSFQKIELEIKNSIIETINKTIKFKRNADSY